MGTIVGWITITDEELNKLKCGEYLHNLELPSNISYDIDKSWEMMHFLLTGSKYPTENVISEIIFPKQYINYYTELEYKKYAKHPRDIPIEEWNQIDEKVSLSEGYILSVKIPMILKELSKIKFESHLTEFNLSEMIKHDIYKSEIWLDINELKEYILPKYKGLVSFFEKVALRKYNVIAQMES